MGDEIICIDRLYKQYRLGVINHGMLYKDLQSWWARFRGRDDPNMKIIDNRKNVIKGDRFWALKNVSFEIKRGEVVGIIGKNGAGKSTLLKVLSRVTSPTRGIISLRGRVSSLLEVGTGFHPELTGRENVFLNGAILGMTKKEIAAKFNDIVSFAEIESFIDTPVKRYSSGMYVRLAFAVAAFLEPEILIVDEVLAVGDLSFQRKCLGKMSDVSKKGRTILFVSHNMSSIEQLCERIILFDRGEIVRDGNDVQKIIRDYTFSGVSSDFPASWRNTGDKYINDYFMPLEMFFSDQNGNRVQMPVRNDEGVWINIEAEVRKIDPTLYIGMQLYSEEGIMVFGSVFTDGPPDKWPEIKRGRTILRCRIPDHLLNEGIYKIELNGGLLDREWFFLPGMENPSVFLEIKGGLSMSPYWTQKRLGVIAPILQWTN